MTDKDDDGRKPDPSSSLIFALQTGEIRFSLDTPNLLRCLRAVADARLVPPLPETWWETLPADLLQEENHHD